ncbi:nucleotidyltransferase domain-containing protein [Catellatospora coxensis]
MAAARRLVEDRYPHARWAMLTGSVLTAARTPGSDLDILVFFDEGDALPFREWQRWAGFNVDLFAYDQPGLDRYLGFDLRDGNPALHRMVAGDSCSPARTSTRPGCRRTAWACSPPDRGRSPPTS